jgi:HPt (histidine-containing phosphotransfer) domain-containing protein
VIATVEKQPQVVTPWWNARKGTFPVEAQLNAPPDTTFCPDELLARCLGKSELMKRVLCRFGDTFAKDYDLLASAVQRSNAVEAALVAHRLKGAAANVSAPAIRDVAATIEGRAREQDWADAGHWLLQLQDEWRRFSNTVSDYL